MDRLAVVVDVLQWDEHLDNEYVIHREHPQREAGVEPHARVKHSEHKKYNYNHPGSRLPGTTEA